MLGKGVMGRIFFDTVCLSRPEFSLRFLILNHIL
jgi:hypothetical protein